jgi:transcriptional regulator with XRE-family HTH domain
LTSKRSFTTLKLMQRLATRLRARREALGWSQAEVAKRAALSRVYVNKLEQRLQDPRLSVVARLAAALKVKISDLVD